MLLELVQNEITENIYESPAERAEAAILVLAKTLNINCKVDFMKKLQASKVS